METMLCKLLCFCCFVALPGALSEEPEIVKIMECPSLVEGCCPVADNFTYELFKLFKPFKNECNKKAKEESDKLGQSDNPGSRVFCMFSCFFEKSGWIDEEGWFNVDGMKNTVFAILPPIPGIYDIMEEKFEYLAILADKIKVEFADFSEAKECNFFCTAIFNAMLSFVYSNCPESQRIRRNKCDAYFDKLKTCLKDV